MGAPVGALLLLVELDAEEFLHQVLQAMPVGVGAGELGGDLGAVEGARVDAEVILDHGHVEARVMEDLGDGGVGEQRLEVWRVVAGAVELHQMGIAVTGGELHEAELVTAGNETQRFGVDGDGASEIEPRRQVALVKLDCHGSRRN